MLSLHSTLSYTHTHTHTLTQYTFLRTHTHTYTHTLDTHTQISEMRCSNWLRKVRVYVCVYVNKWMGASRVGRVGGVEEGGGGVSEKPGFTRCELYFFFLFCAVWRSRVKKGLNMRHMLAILVTCMRGILYDTHVHVKTWKCTDIYTFVYIYSYTYT